LGEIINMSDQPGAPAGTPPTSPTPAPPVTPAPGTPPTPPTPAPAAKTGPLSVTEAAKLLGEQRKPPGEGEPRRRRQQRAEAPGLTPAGSPSVATPQPTARTNGAAAPATPAAGDVFSDLATVLGPPGAAGNGAAAPGTPPTPPTPGAPLGDSSVMTIEIEGKPQNFTGAQLRTAVMQAADYTRKTQELAQFHRQLEDQRSALATVLPLIQPEIERLTKTMQGVQRPDPALLDTDPARYHREHAAWEHAREEQGRLAELATLQAQQAEHEMAQRVEQGHKLLSQKLPFWTDAKQRTAVQQALAEWGLKEGYSRDELRQLADPRHLITMTKAMLWDRMSSGTRTTTPVSDAPPPRGLPPPPPLPADVNAAEERFSERPTARAGAALLSARRRQNTRLQ
jgi:hypothetical protein